MPGQITFSFTNPINESLQICDSVYYCPTQSHGGFNTVDNENLSLTGIVHIGPCTNIWIDNTVFPPTYNIDVKCSDGTCGLPTYTNTQCLEILSSYRTPYYIMFNKSTQTNRNSLLGYYAEVTLGNDSPDIAELFMVSTEISESSK
jgi:hypothetical protein